MRAARLPAWSSPNFLTTANGKPAPGWRCWKRSARERIRFSTRWVYPSHVMGDPHDALHQPIGEVERQADEEQLEVPRRPGRWGDHLAARRARPLGGQRVRVPELAAVL